MLAQHTPNSLRRIAAGTSALALATALVAGPAQAQLSYNAGDPTVVSGSVNFVRGQVPGLEVYTVNSNTAVLDFTPSDSGVGGGAINFQNAGTTVRYERIGQDFTVLNRIVPVDPTRAIQFDGAVQSRIVSTITNPGGSVWFYSPGGIVLGSGAVFDVGSLLLATGDPTGGSGTIAATDSFSIASKADSNYAITVQPGAQITASPEGSYVALVAPIVNQNGSVKVNGAAAFVAAEQATLSIDQGLFDIDVVVGSDGGGTPLTHLGSTEGPSSTGVGDNHGIYMVAVPKNTAITMLISPSGDLGFDTAAIATIENGAIYLQAGGDVSIDASKTIVNRIQDLPQSAQPASIQLNGGNITSRIAAQASGDTAVFAAAGLAIAGEAYFYGGRNSTLVAQAGKSITADGRVTVNSFGNGAPGKAQVDALAGSTISVGEFQISADEFFSGRGIPAGFDLTQGGSAALRSTGGTITVAGVAGVGAAGRPLAGVPSPVTGGTADITATAGGTITIGTNAFVNARADAAGPGQLATGGSAVVNADGGSIKATNLISLSASAAGQNGANAKGGSALVFLGANGGAIETKAVQVIADGTGGNIVSGTGGAATGGVASVTTAAVSVGGAFTFDTVTISAQATGGTGTSSATVTGGAATGGQAQLFANKGSKFAATGVVDQSAVARGGVGVAGGAGGSATQGDARIGAFDGATIGFASARLNADTFGGTGGVGVSPTSAGGTGGAAIKGVGASVFAGGGAAITGGKTEVLAIARSGLGGDGFGGTGFAGAGGAAEAGSAIVSTDTGGSITLGATTILAGTTAAATGAGQANGVLVSGPALGGVSTLNAKAGTIQLASVLLATDAIGGKGVAAGATGGAATGGKAFVGANGGGTLKVGPSGLTVNSGAVGGAGGLGKSGGAATAGLVTVDANGGAITFEAATLSNTAAGGAGGVGPAPATPAGAGGLATGGTVTVQATNGTLTGKATQIAASVDGGTGGNGAGGTGIAGSGGDALGSTISLNTALGGQIKLSAVTTDGRASGGSTGLGVGGGTTTGGSTKGGSLTVNAGAGLIELVDLDAPLSGFAGSGLATGSDGGDAVGGTFAVFTQAGGTFRITTGELSVDTEADGGFNSGGGDLTGGNATAGNITLTGLGAIEILGTDLTLNASAFAGDFSQTGNGGKGGKAVSGFIDLNTAGTLTVNGPTTLFSQAEGGNTASLSGGTGGGAFGGKAFISAVKGAGSFTGAVFMDVSAIGGNGAGASAGGVAVGGRARIGTDAQAGGGSGPSTLGFAGAVTMNVDGKGGDSATGTGGAGYGGQAPIAGISTQESGIEIHVLGGSIGLTKAVSLTARGTGGAGGVGGLGDGGRATVIAFGGSITGQQFLFASAAGTGGNASSGLGGEGGGGIFNIQTQDGGFGVPVGTPASVTLADVTASADGRGGTGQTGGGVGLGGFAGATSFATQNKIALNGTVNLTALGTGGAYLGSGSGAGGIGQGGTAQIGSQGGAVTLANSVNVRADGFGGAANSGNSGNGGDGKGGTVFYFANIGSVSQASGGITLSAEGFGGFAGTLGSGGTGGAGTGGIVDLNVFGNGTIDSKATFVSVDVSGDGGSASGVGNGTGGAGLGGNARVIANSGSLTLRSNVDVIADGGGGFGTGTGNGGTGTGGEARVGTQIGSAASTVVTITGNVDIDASGFGGFGGFTSGIGGAGFGGVPADPNNGPFNKGAYLAATGGTVTIGGTASLDASGTGADGGLQGGAGTGGLAEIFTAGATVDVAGSVLVDASGTGGDAEAALGGLGGTGTGGFSRVTAGSGGRFSIPTTATSRVTISTLIQTASGTGGGGGEGAPGAAGGRGGDGVGGQLFAVAQAGGGQLAVATGTLAILGEGGEGGVGGAEDANGIGGAGGRGGDGRGGFSNIGTVSGPDTPINLGSAELTDVNVLALGFGGIGGDGTVGSKGGGAGGDGGTGFGGQGAVLSRGTPLTFNSITFNADAFGGQAGAGSTKGAGGRAEAGSAGIIATNRFNRTERGSINGSSFVASTIPLGGIGSATGATVAGQGFAQVSKADITLDNLRLTSFGDAPPPAGFESYIKVDNGLLAAGNLDVSAVGNVQVSVVDNGILRAGTFFLSATGSLLPPVAGAPGTIEIDDDFSVSFNGDYIATFDIASVGNYTVFAGGQIQTGAIVSNASIDLTGASIKTGAIKATDSIRLSAEGTITTGDLTAALGDPELIRGEALIQSLGSVSLGNVQAADIDIVVGDPVLAPGSSLSALSLKAETISVDVANAITIGAITTGDFYDDPSGGDFLIGIGANNNVTLGDITAFTSIGAGSAFGAVKVGNVTAADSVMLLGQTGVTSGAIAAGSGETDAVFISNTSIIGSNPDFAVLQDFAAFGGLFDISKLASAIPVRVGGPVTINGPVAVSNFAAAASGAFQSDNIAAPNRLFIDVGGQIISGSLSTARQLTLIADQPISLGDLTAESVDLKSSQSITVGAINATGAVKIDASFGLAQFGGLVTGATIDVVSNSIDLGEGGALGGFATQRVSLTASSGSPRFGTVNGDGNYHLADFEIRQIRAQTIEFRTEGTALIGSFTLDGAASDGGNLLSSGGQLVFNGGSGSVRVVGQVTLRNATSDNRVAIFANGGIDFATDQGGGIAIVGTSPATLAGRLTLEGNSIRAASNSLLGQLATLSPQARAEALATPPAGSPRPEGYLQARRIEFTTNQLYIQNSNTAAQFGGFSAGAGGANLRGRGSTPIDAIIFGRIADSSGAFKINQDAVGLLTLNNGEGTTNVAAGSLFNNCPFDGSCGGVVPPPEQEEGEVEQMIDRIPAVIAAAVNGGLSSAADPESVAALPTVNLVTTIDTGPLRTEPVISDPVTGGGNPSLWDGALEEDERPTPGQGGGK